MCGLTLFILFLHRAFNSIFLIRWTQIHKMASWTTSTSNFCVCLAHYRFCWWRIALTAARTHLQNALTPKKKGYPVAFSNLDVSVLVKNSKDQGNEAYFWWCPYGVMNLVQYTGNQFHRHVHFAYRLVNFYPHLACRSFVTTCSKWYARCDGLVPIISSDLRRKHCCVTSPSTTINRCNKYFE